MKYLGSAMRGAAVSAALWSGLRRWRSGSELCKLRPAAEGAAPRSAGRHPVPQGVLDSGILGGVVRDEPKSSS